MFNTECIECGAFDDCNCGMEPPHEAGPDCGCDDCEREAREQAACEAVGP